MSDRSSFSQPVTRVLKTNTESLNIVHTESSLGWGGQEIRILTEAQGMMDHGHRVTVLCPPEAQLYDEACRRNIPVTALPIARKRWRGVHVIYRWLSTHPADVVNVHSSTDSWLVALAAKGLKQAPPMVRTRHISSPVPNNPPTRWLYQTATRHIVTTGARLRQQLIDDNGFAPAHITSVPTGIDINRFTPGDRQPARRMLGLAENGIIIGNVATLRTWKGLQYLIDAFARLSDTSSRLLLVGDGPRRQALMEQAQALGLSERILFPGNQRDVLPWLRALDIFVLPSYANEGVPQAIIQAMLCRLPVITTAIGSITEAIDHEHTGLIVAVKDSDALVRAIERLLADAGLRQSLGESGRAYAGSHFALETMLTKMETVFTQSIRSRFD